MSKRKRYRKVRDQAVKDNLREMMARRRAKAKEEREQAVRDELMKGRMLYEAFKDEMCKEGAYAPDIIQRFEAFKKMLKRKIKNKDVLRAMLAEASYAEIKFVSVYGPRGNKAPSRLPEPPVEPGRN